MGKILTSKVCVLYYSATGNTKALVNICESECDVFTIRNFDFNKLENYEKILIGTSTWGEGIPPKVFFNLKQELLSIKNKQIGLFGSGNAHFEYYCGALDLLSEMLNVQNDISFVFKYEGYPKETIKNQFKTILEEFKNDKTN